MGPFLDVGELDNSYYPHLEQFQDTSILPAYKLANPNSRQVSSCKPGAVVANQSRILEISAIGTWKCEAKSSLLGSGSCTSYESMVAVSKGK